MHSPPTKFVPGESAKSAVENEKSLEKLPQLASNPDAGIVIAMRILLYEYLTGGGLFEQPALADSASLLREGAAMLTAVAADFAAIAEVVVIRDRRFTDLGLS